MNREVFMNAEEFKQEIVSVFQERYDDTPGPDNIPFARLNDEWEAVKRSGCVADLAAFFNITNWLKQRDLAYWVNGAGGSSFLLYVMGVTEANPLPPHLYCPKCKKIFSDERTAAVYDGFDIPAGARCPVCGEEMAGDGHDVPWQSMWGCPGEGETMREDEKPFFGLRVPNRICGELQEALPELWPTSETPKIDLRPYSGGEGGMIHLSQIIITGDPYLNTMFPDENNKVDASCRSIAVDRWEDLVALDYFREQNLIFDVPEPKTFADLIADFGLLHSQGAWDGETRFMATRLGYQSADFIAFREDIFRYLTEHHVAEKDAWRAMLGVMKGNGLVISCPELDCSRDKWVKYLCGKRIRYLSPKAHALEYIFFSLRTSVFNRM
jgi:hypothetical protein